MTAKIKDLVSDLNAYVQKMKAAKVNGPYQVEFPAEVYDALLEALKGSWNSRIGNVDTNLCQGPISIFGVHVTRMEDQCA